MIRIGLVSFVLAFAVVVPELASASVGHSNRCHIRHTCPSDHATYRWRGLLCVKPTADERTSAFKRRIAYGGKTYYCRG